MYQVVPGQFDDADETGRFELYSLQLFSDRLSIMKRFHGRGKTITYYNVYVYQDL